MSLVALYGYSKDHGKGPSRKISQGNLEAGSEMKNIQEYHLLNAHPFFAQTAFL